MCVCVCVCVCVHARVSNIHVYVPNIGMPENYYTATHYSFF